MQAKIITQNDWCNIQDVWKSDAVEYADDLTYLPSIHESHGEILAIYSDSQYPLMVTNLIVAQLPGMSGNTLRSTKSAFAPSLEFDDLDAESMFEMYATLVFFVYKYSIGKDCDNIKVYTPQDHEMQYWEAMLNSLCKVEKINRTVQYQGRWTALVKRYK